MLTEVQEIAAMNVRSGYRIICPVIKEGGSMVTYTSDEQHDDAFDHTMCLNYYDSEEEGGIEGVGVPIGTAGLASDSDSDVGVEDE